MTGPVVLSHNEWDPLEEVIVGVAVGAAQPAFEPAFAPFVPLGSPDRDFPGRPFPDEAVARAQRQLDGLAATLEREGVVVRRPEAVSHDQPVRTPDFAVPFGHAQVCPRDVMLVVGDEIIEAPMANRSRFFEYRAYRPLVKEYFRRGARWTAAPKPQMSDALYVPGYDTVEQPYDLDDHPNLTEFEPCFDAASFIRCGRDIFWQPDVVTNAFGAEWLARHLGAGYRLHRVEFHDRSPQHIDTTLVPLAPGLALTNPERPFKKGTDALFRASGWRLVEAVPSVRTGPPSARDVSNWISLNVLSLDERTVVVDAAEEPLAELLRSLGMDVVPVPFDAVFAFGGSFHCCTVDIRRRGELASYFSTEAVDT